MTGYYYAMRDEPDFGVGVATATWELVTFGVDAFNPDESSRYVVASLGPSF